MSGLIQGFADFQQGRADAAIAEHNAKMAEQQAVVERQQAGAAEELQRKQFRRFAGKQRAAIVQSGIGSGGSALDIARQSAVDAELDALNIRYQGELRYGAAKAQASQFRAQARAAKTQGRLALGAGLLQTGEQAYAMGGGR